MIASAGRMPIVAGNWKMNTTLAESLALVDSLAPRLRQLDDVERVVCPPFTWLVPVRERIAGSSLLLGAQNLHWEPKGAYTGEISGPMLAGIADYVIVGHCERRQYFGETDETVNRKLRAALSNGLKPILCVGETLDQRDAGKTEQVISTQVRAGLASIEHATTLVVAYEPVWAIGTERAATGEGANQVGALIRSLVGEQYGAEVAGALRIQYGGSVTPENFAEFIAQPDIDGALVGGASLKAASFVDIVALASRSRQ